MPKLYFHVCNQIVNCKSRSQPSTFTMLRLLSLHCRSRSNRPQGHPKRSLKFILLSITTVQANLGCGATILYHLPYISLDINTLCRTVIHRTALIIARRLHNTQSPGLIQADVTSSSSNRGMQRIINNFWSSLRYMQRNVLWMQLRVKQNVPKLTNWRYPVYPSLGNLTKIDIELMRAVLVGVILLEGANK